MLLFRKNVPPFDTSMRGVGASGNIIISKIMEIATEKL